MEKSKKHLGYFIRPGGSSRSFSHRFSGTAIAVSARTMSSGGGGPAADGPLRKEGVLHTVPLQQQHRGPLVGSQHPGVLFSWWLAVTLGEGNQNRGLAMALSSEMVEAPLDTAPHQRRPSPGGIS